MFSSVALIALEKALSKKKVAPAKAATPKSKHSQPAGTTERNPASFIMSVIPREVLDGDDLGTFIDKELAWRVEMLSGSAFDPWLNPTQVSPEQAEILDNVIIFQAETLGSLALASSIVRGRVHAWREDYQAGVEKTECLMKALVTAVRIHQRLDPAPIDPTMKEKKRVFVEELEVVLRRIRQTEKASRVSLSHTELQRLLEEAISNAERSYLKRNLESWKEYIAARPRDFHANLDKPAMMFDEWLAFWTGRRVEALRQKISKL